MCLHRRIAAWLPGAALIALLSASSATDIPATTYLVTFDAPPSTEQVNTLSGVALSVHAYRHLPAAVAVIVPSDASVLAHLPGVRGVYPNRPLLKTLRQSTRVIAADRVWTELGITGDGIGIAVIDTGIDGTHPDLCAAATFCRQTPVKTVQNVKILGRQDVAVDPVVVLENQISTDTSSGHGTHVAGIAAGQGVASAHEAGKYRGVAPGARLIGLGTGELVEAVNVLAAFDWVIENKDDPRYNIKVVNNSWGPGKGTAFDPEDPVQRAIVAAHAAGLTVVFGAGNDGPTTDTLNAFSVNPKAISAAAGAKDGNIAVFSSRGIPAHALWHPTVTTPGANIASARASTGFLSDVADALAPNPDVVIPPDTVYYATGNGTSMAAPHVAGIVALMQEAAFDARAIYLTPDQVKNILQNTAVSRDPSRGLGGLPNYQGYTMGAGYADALAAVQAAASGTSAQAYNDGVAYDVRGFAGSISPTAPAFETTYTVAAGAVALDVMADWTVGSNDIDLELYRPDNSLHSSTFLRCAPADEPNGYSSFCTQIANERSTATTPAPGQWRAVVRGAFAAAETVRGLWSVAYADGSTLPPAQQPGSLNLEANTVGVTGQDVALLATVRDSDANPVPNATVTWTSAGVGGFSLTETSTHADGSARARARSHLPGSQTVSVTTGSLTDSVTITWIGLGPIGAPSTPGKASGGGWLMASSKRSFGFWAEFRSAASAAAGALSFDDHQGTKVRSDGVTQLLITGNRAVVNGLASVNSQSGYRFEIEAVDQGEPGRDDSFRLLVTRDSDPLFRYETAGTLAGGNLKIESY